MFTESVYQRLDLQAMVEDLADLGASYMPWYDLYDNSSQNGETFPSLEVESDIPPKWGDQYLNVKISLEGTRWLETEWCIGSITLMVIQLVYPI